MSASNARTWVKRDASKFSGLTASMSGESFSGELVEFASASIPLDLEIPGIRVVMLEPIAEFLQTGSIQLLDFSLEQLNLCHILSLAGVFPDNKTPSAVCGELPGDRANEWLSRRTRLADRRSAVGSSRC